MACSPAAHQRGALADRTGLRLFVDRMMQVAEPSADAWAEAGLSEAVIDPWRRRPPRCRACRHAWAVSCPSMARVGWWFVRCQQALVVLVAGDGAVENRVIDVPAGLVPRHSSGGQFLRDAVRPDADRSDGVRREIAPNASRSTAPRRSGVARARDLVVRRPTDQC